MMKLNLYRVLFFLCGLALFFGLAGTGYAQTWTGDVDSDWHTGGNWSSGSVPTSGSTVYVDPVGGNPYPVISQDVTISELYISDSGSGGEVTVANGATLTITSKLSVGDNGALYIIENSTVEASGGLITSSSSLIDISTGTFTSNIPFDLFGTFNVGDGTANFNSSVTVKGDAVLNVDTGTINSGAFTLSVNSTVNMGSGALNVSGNLNLIDNSTFNAEGSTITFTGEYFTNGETSNFNPGTSTFIFDGNGDQYLAGATTFYNLEIRTRGNLKFVTSDSNITVLNNLYVQGNTTLIMDNNTSLEVYGEITNHGTISSSRPYVNSVTTTGPTQVVVYFSENVTQASSQNTGNYAIDNGISVTGAVRDASDFSKVILTVSVLTHNQKYTLMLNNIQASGGGNIRDNYTKKFVADVAQVFYSRQDGPWDDPNSWSTSGHTGPAAASTPVNANNDSVIVGNGHTIDIQTDLSIDSLALVEVNGTAKLAVGSAGTLTLADQLITGTGEFAVNSGGILQISLPVGIAASGASGNIRTGTRTFGTGGNYHYIGSAAQITGTGLPVTVNNLVIDNPTGVTATADLQVTGTLYLTDGTLTVPSGQNLVANTKNINSGSLRFLRSLSGNPGWRLLSPPVGSTYGDFLDSVITQGYPGAFYDSSVAPNDTLQPNVLWYDETTPGTDNQRWRALTSAGDVSAAGRGLFVYVFGDVPSDSRYNTPLPNTLSVSGQEFEGTGGTVDLNVTYTASADTGWNLVGNPFGATIDWDNAGGWTKTNMSNTIYVWDANANSGNGDFLTWNGVTGSLGNGLIAPFQGFWVKANGAGPTLAVNQSAKTIGGTFHGKESSRRKNMQSAPVIEFTLQGEGLETRSYLMFSEEGTTAWDDYDAYRLLPYSETYAELFFVARDGSQLSINSLPRKFGIPIEIPLYVGAFEDGIARSGNFNLSWNSLATLPPDWQVVLEDRHTGEKTDLRIQDRASFNLSASKGKTAPAMSPGSAVTVKTKSSAKKKEARFVLTIEPGADAEGLPQQVRLHPNYPNPFNSTTTFNFELPVENRVTLEVYDILGRKVATLIDNKLIPAGTHNPTWNAGGYASGVYIFRLLTDSKIFVKKMTHLK